MKRATAILALFAFVLSGCSSPVADNPDVLKGGPTPPRPSSAAALRPVALVRAPGPQPVWVALEGAGKVVKVDVASRRVLRRFEVPGTPTI